MKKERITISLDQSTSRGLRIAAATAGGTVTDLLLPTIERMAAPHIPAKPHRRKP